MPLVSVIVPTRDRPETLARALLSIRAQDIESLQVVVVDDGEKILAKATCNAVHGLDISYIRNVTGIHGAGHSRNLGAAHALGEYITFLDDDDTIMPGRLSNMLRHATGGNNVFISSGRFYECDDFSEIREVKSQKFGTIRLEDIKYSNTIDIGIMIRKEIFLGIGGFDTSFKNLEDWDLMLRLLTLGPAFKVQRYDYAVNVTSGRARVSTNDHIGYVQLAQKHAASFGPKWHAFMLAMAVRLSSRGSLSKYCGIAWRHKSALPLLVYLRQQAAMLHRRIRGTY